MHISFRAPANALLARNALSTCNLFLFRKINSHAAFRSTQRTGTVFRLSKIRALIFKCTLEISAYTAPIDRNTCKESLTNTDPAKITKSKISHRAQRLPLPAKCPGTIYWLNISNGPCFFQVKHHPYKYYKNKQVLHILPVSELSVSFLVYFWISVPPPAAFPSFRCKPQEILA